MSNKTIAFIFIVAGILMMAYTGFNYNTTEKLIDAGPIKIEREKTHPVSWSPIFGGVLLATGILILVLNKKINK